MTDLQRALDHLAGYRVARGRYAYTSGEEGVEIEYTLDARPPLQRGARGATGESCRGQGREADRAPAQVGALNTRLTIDYGPIARGPIAGYTY